MSNGRVVKSSLGEEVLHDRGLVPAEPGIGVGAVDPVLGVGERAPLSKRRGSRRSGRRGRRVGHGGHRTAGALLTALGLLLGTLLPGLAVGAPAQGKDPVVFHVAMLGEGVDSLNPFLGIQAALTRKQLAKGAPEQKQTLADSLAAYTRDGAYSEFTEDRKGQIKPGYFADVVILDRDIEATAPENIGKVKPAVTIGDGRVTFEA